MRYSWAMGLAVGCLAMTAGAAAADEVVLWRGAQAGMSVDAVRALLPELTSVPSSLLKATEQLLTMPTEVDGQAARADLIFENDALDRVYLRFDDKTLQDMFAKRQKVTAKYGEPIDCGVQRDLANWYIYACRWIKDGVDIKMDFSRFSSSSGTEIDTTVSYKRAVTKEVGQDTEL